MHVTTEPHATFTILHVSGELDNVYCPLLEKEIDDLINTGVVRIVLNLGQVKFINSSAMRIIIVSAKKLVPKKGKLAISQPSAFCRDILAKVGLDRVVSIFENDEDAEAGLNDAKPTSW